MQRISISAAKPGMVLARPIAKSDGRLIARVGQVLTRETIARLRSEGVASLLVESEREGTFRPEDAEAVRSAISHLFRKHTGDPYMMGLRSMLEEYFADKCEGDDKPPKTEKGR